MAVDPNQPMGSWGLGALGTPLGAPSTSTAPLAPKMAFSPAEIAQMRAHALALQQPPEKIQSWTQGVAELMRAIQGNREADFARQQEATGRQGAADAITSLYKPYLSGGAAAIPDTSTGSTGSVAPTSGNDTGTSSPGNSSTVTAGNSEDPRGMMPYIRETAAKYGVDPEVALRVARSEGLREFYGDGGKSGGAFQLYTGGGMGNDFQKDTGLDPLDPANEKATIDYALKNVPRVGWTPFHGARKVGIGAREGIGEPPKTTAQATGLFAQIPQGYAADDTETAALGLPPEIAQGQTPRAAAAPAAPPSAAQNPLVNAIVGRSVPPIAAASTPPGQLPSPGGPVSPQDFARAAAAMEAAKGGPSVPLPSTPINQPPPGISPADFSSAAAAMEAAKGPPVPLPSTPINQPSAGIQPADFARAAAAMEAAKPTTSVPFGTAVPGATPDLPPPAAAAPPIAGPVPTPTPRPTFPLPAGSAIPGAVGPTSVGGAPLVAPGGVSLAGPPSFGPTSTGGRPLPQAGGLPPATLVNAIAGRDAALPPAAAGGGAPAGGAPIRVAQNGPATGGPPGGAGGPSGLPQPLTSPVGQISPQQLTQMLANPWVPDSAKAAMLQMIQQRAQPQSMPVEGGTLMYDAAGRKVFIPEPRFGTIKIGGAEIPTVSRFDPASRQWNTTTLAPGGGVQTSGAPPAGSAPAPAGGGVALPPTGGAASLPHPAVPQTTPQPDLSSIGGIMSSEAAQAGAKKRAETEGETGAKYYDSLHRGVAGSAMIAAQQKQNIDLLRQIGNSPDFVPGAGSDAALAAQRWMAQFGINPEGAAPRELFNQIATRVLADQISGIKSMSSETGEAGGRIFKTMVDLEEKANITPEDTPTGIMAKLNIVDKAGDLAMKWGAMADEYLKTHGSLDADFDKTLREEISKARIPNAVPQSSAAPSQSDIEAEMRRRKLLPPAGPAVAPVSQ